MDEDAGGGDHQRIAGARGRGLVGSGAFTVAGGAVVPPDANEARPPRRGLAAAAGEGRIETTSDGIAVGALSTVVSGDLVVYNSACIGADCSNGEVFGFDTLRLKENNLRIGFVDTSAGSFPSTDWQLTANDSANGGANRFSVDDVTGGRTPFTLTAGAPTHSLFVAGTGNVGLGTSTPATRLHLVTNDTPTIRLDQDGSGGFPPQAWDIMANEAALEIRDITAGATAPLRIRAGAPTDSIHVSANGFVGLGTGTPQGALDVNGAIFQRGAQLHADYVFAPSFVLEPLAVHQRFARENRHLPSVPGRTVDGDGREVVELGAHQRGMLEELEKAYLYIEQLSAQLDEKAKAVEELRARLDRVEAALGAIETPPAQR